MIDKQTQDQLWGCASKAFRETVKNTFNIEKEHPIIRGGYGDIPPIAYYNDVAQFLCDLFGKHNLTSDSEPEEMLVVEKGKVQFLFDGLDDTPVRCEFDKGYKTGKEFILHSLFGSKCLPDEPLSQNSAENCDNGNPISKPGPKFNVGDKVRVCHKYVARYGKVGVVIEDCNDGTVLVDFNDNYVGGHLYAIDFLEPYTEPSQPKPTTIWKRKN